MLEHGDIIHNLKYGILRNYDYLTKEVSVDEMNRWNNDSYAHKFNNTQYSNENVKINE